MLWRPITASRGVLVVGGSDIEVDASWNDYPDTNQWVVGYYQAGNTPMYDYGDTCQHNGNYTSLCTNANPTSGWTPCTVYDVAWGYGFAEPTPEIYSAYWAQTYADMQNNSHEIKACGDYFHGAMQFEGIANETWAGDPYNTAWDEFTSDLGSGNVITPEDTCFPDVNTKYPVDECY